LSLPRRIREILRQKELHKKRFEFLYSEGAELLSENNSKHIKKLIKSIPKEKSKDPLTYNPDMKHFVGSLHGSPLGPMKEREFYGHLTDKGVSDQGATELIMRLKAPHDNKEKIDKLLTTAGKFRAMAKKQVPEYKPGKRRPAMNDKQKSTWAKYHALGNRHVTNAKGLGYDPKHPLWKKDKISESIEYSGQMTLPDLVDKFKQKRMKGKALRTILGAILGYTAGKAVTGGNFAGVIGALLGASAARKVSIEA
jgi:hypothetical protein